MVKKNKNNSKKNNDPVVIEAGVDEPAVTETNDDVSSEKDDVIDTSMFWSNADKSIYNLCAANYNLQMSIAEKLGVEPLNSVEDDEASNAED